MQQLKNQLFIFSFANHLGIRVIQLPKYLLGRKKVIHIYYKYIEGIYGNVKLNFSKRRNALEVTEL
jgi:hypothetical protein